MTNELFERELQNTSINDISLIDYIKKNYIPKKHGKWINRKNVVCLENVRWKYECSKCGYEVRSKYNFCPNCGHCMIELQKRSGKE